MRELAYQDPFVKILKETILQRLEQMAAEARLRRHRMAVEAEQGRSAMRQAIERSLIEVCVGCLVCGRFGLSVLGYTLTSCIMKVYSVTDTLPIMQW